MYEILVKIAQTQREEYLAAISSDGVERDIEAALRAAVSTSVIKAVVGPRRAGKSTIIQRVLSDVSHAYFNFEDDRLPQHFDNDVLLEVLQKVWGQNDNYFFDELQIMPRWEQFIHRLHRNRKNIFITGSNSKLLSTELATSLTGRYHSFMLLPFSWNETRRAEKSSQIHSLPSIADEFYRYLTEGGFPDVVLRKSEHQSYLANLWGAILSRDIVDRHKIRNIGALRALGELVLRSVGSRVSGRGLQKSLPHSISNTTLENYLSYGEEAFLFQMLHKFEPSLAKQKKADRKPYVFDTGFIRAVRPSLVSLSQGQLLENFVFLELLRRGAQPNIDLFYFQSPKQEEVDFVFLKSGESPELIQVCWSLKDPKTYAREVRALVAAASAFGAKTATIVTFDDSRVIFEDGLEIHVVKAWH